MIRELRPSAKRKSLAEFRAILREQFLLVCLDEERAITALPKLLGSDDVARRTALDLLHRILAARDEMSGEAQRRLAHVEGLFGVKPEKAVKVEASHA